MSARGLWHRRPLLMSKSPGYQKECQHFSSSGSNCVVPTCSYSSSSLCSSSPICPWVKKPKALLYPRRKVSRWHEGVLSRAKVLTEAKDYSPAAGGGPYHSEIEFTENKSLCLVILIIWPHWGNWHTFQTPVVSHCVWLSMQSTFLGTKQLERLHQSDHKTVKGVGGDAAVLRVVTSTDTEP